MYSDLKELDLDKGKPVSEDEISKFEKELNISFGDEFYQDFLNTTFKNSVSGLVSI